MAETKETLRTKRDPSFRAWKQPNALAVQVVQANTTLPQIVSVTTSSG